MVWLLLALAVVVGAMVLWTARVSREVDRRVPPDGPWIEVPGARIHYVDLGPRDAPVLLMVHGLMGQMRNFTHSLSERMAADYRVVVIDRPGWGHSSLTGPRLDMAGQARAVADFIAALGLERPLLVGHSMGGALGLALALDHPRVVRGLALIAPYAQPVDQPPEPFKSLQVPRGLRTLIAWTIAVPIALRTAAKKSVRVFAPDAVPADFPIKGGGALGIRPKSFLSGCYEIGLGRPAMERQSPRYDEIALPVAILYGRGDALLDPELHGRRTAEAIPGATLTLVEGGHMLPVTHADITERWLRNLASSPS